MLLRDYPRDGILHSYHDIWIKSDRKNKLDAIRTSHAELRDKYQNKIHPTEKNKFLC